MLRGVPIVNLMTKEGPYDSRKFEITPVDLLQMLKKKNITKKFLYLLMHRIH